MNKKEKIEIEFRSIFSEEKYNELKSFLDENAEDLGPDNKNVFFFIMPEKLLKVTNNESKESAKFTLKLNKIGEGSDFKELEIHIEQEAVDKTVKIFKELGFDEVQESYQKRHNYRYKGVEIALKWSQVWTYHIEFEILVDNENEKEAAEEKIKEVADELDVELMSDEELKTFTEKANEEFREGKYDENKNEPN